MNDFWISYAPGPRPCAQQIVAEPRVLAVLQLTDGGDGKDRAIRQNRDTVADGVEGCLLYTSDAADE